MTREEIAEFIESAVRFKHQVSHDAVNFIAEQLAPEVTERVDQAYSDGKSEGDAEGYDRGLHEARPVQNFVSTPGDGV